MIISATIQSMQSPEGEPHFVIVLIAILIEREGTTLKANALNAYVNSGMNDMARIDQ